MNIILFKLKLVYKDFYYSDKVLNRDRLDFHIEEFIWSRHFKELSFTKVHSFIIKRRQKLKKLFMFLIVILMTSNLFSQSEKNLKSNISPNDTLVVLWTSGDPEVAEKVCFMYTHNALKRDWFKTVILIVWGPSANLLANNSNLESKVKSMISDGIQLKACKACSDSYGVSDKLRDIGIEVIYMGNPLTKYLKSGYSILNF